MKIFSCFSFKEETLNLYSSVRQLCLRVREEGQKTWCMITRFGMKSYIYSATPLIAVFINVKYRNFGLKAAMLSVQHGLGKAEGRSFVVNMSENRYKYCLDRHHYFCPKVTDSLRDWISVPGK